MICPQCRAAVPDGARFCPSCGHELVVVGDQRRIATVLFADLVGFTALSEALDPEQVKALVDRCFERLAADIETFGGRVDKVVGDAIVALFGAPVAHEDDAERAVRAGLRMQETIAEVVHDGGHPVKMRVGINTGEVLVGAVSGGREYTAMGDVVNTASRLQDAAEPGTVLVGPDTRAATRDAIDYEPVDPVLAKGKRLPVEAWVARGALSLPGQRSRRPRVQMVGRDTELSLLCSVGETAIDRNRAALLVVHGEAGMGKSLLAAEAAQRLRDERGTLVLEGRCVPYGEANVWWPVAEALRTAAGVEPDAPGEEFEAALRALVVAALERSGRASEEDRVLAGLRHLLGQESSLRSIDANRAREEVVRSVVALAEGYTYGKPLLLVVSDIHWASQEVLDLLDTLLARLARRPLVVLATARRSVRERWVPAPEAANSVVLHLDPLDDDASHELLQSLTEGQLHPAMAAMLVDRAGGNPFYLEELVGLIADAGVRSVEQLLASEGGDLPTTLRGLVAARLDALSPEDRQLIDDAAVLGRRERVKALVIMAQVKRRVDEEVVRSQVESLAAREFLVLQDGLYTFRSDVIREVAYSTLTKADRARSHAGIASWIEQYESHLGELAYDGIAHHYTSAAELVADIGSVHDVPADVTARALHWLGLAIQHAEADSLPAAVVKLTTRALGVVGGDEERRDQLLRQRAKARVAVYDLDGAVADLDEVQSRATGIGDDATSAELLLIRAEAEQHRGHYEDALGLLDDAGRIFATLDDVSGRAQTLRQRGMVHLYAGDSEAADKVLTEALDLFEELDDERGRAWALQNLSWSAYISGRVEQAEQWVVASMETFAALGDPGGLVWSRGLLAWVRFHQGRDEEALALASEVGAASRESGERWGEAMMAVLTAAIALWSGRTEDAVEYGEIAVDLFEQIDDRMGEIQAICNLGRARIMAGDISGGVELLQSTLDPDGDVGIEHGSLARVSLLASAVQIGDVDLAECTLSEMERFDEAALGGADRTAAVAIHHLQAGELAPARGALVATSEERGYIDCARALLAAVEGDTEAALAHAAAVDTHPHSYLDRCYAELAAALALTRSGDLDAAAMRVRSVIEELEGTHDRIARAVAGLVDASVGEAAGASDATERRAAAEEQLHELGMGTSGWRRVVADSLGVLTG